MIYIRSQDGAMMTTFSTIYLESNEEGWQIIVHEDGKQYIVASYRNYQTAYQELDYIQQKIATSIGNNIPRSTDIIHRMSSDS